MLFLTTVLVLTAVLHHSLGEEEEEDGMPPGGVLSPKIKKLIIDKHNEIRRKVKPSAANMLKMTWSETVAKQALKWAEQCTFTSSPNVARKLGDTMCGENLYQTNNFKMWKEVIEFWADGKKYFKYGSVPTDPTKYIFGYTQIIWYNSHQVGCAVAYCEKNTFPFLYICHYCPEGNLMSAIPHPYKKGRRCGQCPDSCEDKLCTNPCKYTDSSGTSNCKALQKIHSCKRKFVSQACKATCECTTEIV